MINHVFHIRNYNPLTNYSMKDVQLIIVEKKWHYNYKRSNTQQPMYWSNKHYKITCFHRKNFEFWIRKSDTYIKCNSLVPPYLEYFLYFGSSFLQTCVYKVCFVDTTFFSLKFQLVFRYYMVSLPALPGGRMGGEEPSTILSFLY